MADKELTRQLLQCEKMYDNNDYVHGLKTVERLLKQKKYENCAELIGLKALFLHAQKKKAEAAPLIQQALRADMRNAKIWKFQGIIHKNNGDYTKAAQSFTMAQKLDPKDTTVLQDLCNLYLFERNYKAFLDETKLLLNNNKYPSAVIRYILALELTGSLATAHQVLTKYEGGMLQTENADELIFRSELSLHHCSLMYKLGKYEDLETYLSVNKRIIDLVSKDEWIAKTCSALGKKAETMEAIERLIAAYPENGDYFDMLEKQESGEEYIQHLFKIKEQHKSRYAEVRILELMDIADERFEGLLSAYLVPYLKKGTPAIFVYLAELSPEKLDIAVKIAKSADIPINYIPIVHNFTADVLMAKGDYEAALVEVDAGIAHTPTVLELRSTKIRILKKMGRIAEATAIAKDLMVFDPADRGTNTILMNALLTNGELKEAIIAGKPFAIDHEGKSKLFKTQYNEICMRCGDCAYRAGDNATALVFYNAVVDHFEAFRKSQFNYLGWGMKKTCSVVAMIEWADKLVKNPILATAIAKIMKIKFSENAAADVKDLALKMTNATDPTVLAFTAAFYAMQADPLPALKCYQKITGSAKFAAAPIMEKMMSDLSQAPEIVREVATELYQKFDGKPESVQDFIMSARGALFIGNADAAKEHLTKVAEMKITFKEAVEVFNIAKFEIKQDDFTTQIEAAIHKVYPMYELQIKGKYEVPEELPTNKDDE